MKITAHLFEAFLKCPTKCWLRATNETSTGNIYAQWVKNQNEAYRLAGARRLLAQTPPADSEISPSAENLKGTKWRLAVDIAVTAPDVPRSSLRQGAHSSVAQPAALNSQPPDQNRASSAAKSQADAVPTAITAETRLHAAERVPSEDRYKAAQFIPIRFIFTNNLGKDDRLLLAFDAFVLSASLRCEIAVGKIMHGDDYSTRKVKTSALVGEVRKHLKGIAELLSSPVPPDLCLNRHCAECEFQHRCRQKAEETDDLSLLAGMTEKERNRFRSKGIFTVTQLSYTFRPRRRSRRLRDRREKYHHATKALAIREKKIHIVGSPELKIEGTPVYLDVEGLPDRDFYYLIGVRVGNGDFAVQHSLWADNIEQEGKLFREFLGILESIEKPLLIHYGSYETMFLRRMRQRHGLPLPRSVAATTIKAAVNLLSTLFAQVYFPCRSNSLKEIAGHLGFRWSDTTATGLRSIVWRREWETSRASAAKDALLTYNAEDCQALETLANALVSLSQGSPQVGGSCLGEIVNTAKLRREHPYGFKRNTFAFPELDAINNAAYWDYQRERVYVKSNSELKHVMPRARKPKKVLPANTIIECPRPRACPKCASAKFHKNAKYTKTVFDLRFMRHGIKRWITQYSFDRYQCQRCRSVFQPEETCWGKGKFGSEILAYSLYLNIELRVPQLHVIGQLNRLFGFNLNSSQICNFKAAAAENYKAGYNSLINRLCRGRLLHVDETEVKVRYKDGFVWVFANMEEVAYVYSGTREGDLLQTMLKDFKGVLVSDFYAVYDSIQCPQQKCLIHLLIRA